MIRLVFRQSRDDAANCGDIRIVDALAALVTALDRIEELLPHRAGDLARPRPVLTAVMLDFEVPLTGKFFRAHISALAGRGVVVNPLDITAHVARIVGELGESP